MDLISMVGAGLLTFASKDMIAKLLGPTCDYLGEEVRNLVEKRCKNIGSIFNKAAKKLGNEIDKPGEISPRILKQIIDEGSFCEDNLTQEYYAGLLASSRKEDKNIEDSIPYIKLIERMSSNQIALHYFVYYPIIKELSRLKINLFQSEELQKIKTNFSIVSVLELFDKDNFSTIISNECTLALKEGLITQYKFGIDQDTRADSSKLESFIINNETFLKISPSIYGMNLFLKANNAPIDFHENEVIRIKWCDELNPVKVLDNMPKITDGIYEKNNA